MKPARNNNALIKGILKQAEGGDREAESHRLRQHCPHPYGTWLLLSCCQLNHQNSTLPLAHASMRCRAVVENIW